MVFAEHHMGEMGCKLTVGYKELLVERPDIQVAGQDMGPVGDKVFVEDCKHLDKALADYKELAEDYKQVVVYLKADKGHPEVLAECFLLMSSSERVGME